MPPAMAAKMSAAMATAMKMTSASVTTTVAPAMTAAAFRDCIAPGRQYGRQRNDRNANAKF
jgi:hypothetical protein